MSKKNGHLANGSLLPHQAFDIEYNNNYYKKIDGKWFIFGNLALYPMNDEDIIVHLDYLLTIKEK